VVGATNGSSHHQALDQQQQQQRPSWCTGKGSSSRRSGMICCIFALCLI
jgi:hypothetical protein